MDPIRKKKLIKIALWGLVVLLLALMVWHYIKSKIAATPPPIQPPTVIIQKPVVAAGTQYIEQTGNTVSYNSVDLVARVEGFLQAVKFTDGSFVKKGQELFLIEPEPYLEQLRAAQASVAGAKAQLAYSEAEYARQQKMYKENATSLNNVQKWQAQRDSSKADLDKAIANETNAAITYSYTRVVAPFDGRIGRHLVDPGNLVGNGKATDLATIDQIDPIYVYFYLNELDVVKIRAAAREYGYKPTDINKISAYVGLQNEEGFPHEGKLDFANTGLNSSTGTLEFRVLLSNKDYTLLPGLFVRVRIPITKPAPQLTVPDTAVQYDQIGAYVLVVDKNSKVALKRVEIDSVDNGMRVISKGISSQDDIIVDGLQNATPGSQVKAQRQNNP